MQPGLKLFFTAVNCTGKIIQNNSFSAVQTLSPDTLTASHDNIAIILTGAYEIYHNRAP